MMAFQGGLQRRLQRHFFCVTAILMMISAVPSRAETFPAGSLIIPMDLTYQDQGMLQAYGLVHQLLKHGIPVYWVINEFKTSSTECSSTSQGCSWDCEAIGDDVFCPYFTMSPDLTTAATVLWDDTGLRAAGTSLPPHGYRGGPFVIHAGFSQAARQVIDAWNSPETWAANPWATRSEFQVVSVHEAAQQFQGPVGLILRLAPTPGLLVDGAEAGFAAVLRAAGIFQSDGTEFTEEPCVPGACGPGTARPDFIPIELLNLDSGACIDPDRPWWDTILLDENGNARRSRYAMVATAGFSPALRETVLCEDGPCTVLDDACFTSPMTFHGHRIRQHLHQFIHANGHMLALGQSVYGLENFQYQPGMPMLDPFPESGLMLGVIPPPACPCGFIGYSCVTGGCRDAADLPVDCCLPDDPYDRGAGAVARPGVVPSTYAFSSLTHPVFQLDGDFTPAYGPLGPIGTITPAGASVNHADEGIAAGGGDHLILSDGWFWHQLHYLADVPLSTALPMSSHPETQPSRLFLNALMSSRYSWDVPDLSVYAILSTNSPYCVGETGDLELPALLQLWGPLPVDTFPELTISMTLPEGVEMVFCEGEPVGEGAFWVWRLYDVSRDLQLECRFIFHERGSFPFTIDLDYRWGDADLLSGETSLTSNLDVIGSADSDGDGVIDCGDPSPRNPAICGDWNGNGLDDCSGPEPDADDLCMETDCEYGKDPEPACACTAGSRPPRSTPSPGFALLHLLLLAAGLRHRRRLCG